MVIAGMHIFVFELCMCGYLNNKMLSLVFYRVIKAASIAEKIHIPR
jgi:hypothetical protein